LNSVTVNSALYVSILQASGFTLSIVKQKWSGHLQTAGYMWEDVKIDAAVLLKEILERPFP